MADVHGISITEGSLGAPPINLPEISNIGIIGTAPEATGRFEMPDPNNEGRGLVNYDHPFLITKRGDADSDQFGIRGTLPDALDGIFEQGRAKVVMVIVEEFEDAVEFSFAPGPKFATVDKDTTSNEALFRFNYMTVSAAISDAGFSDATLPLPSDQYGIVVRAPVESNAQTSFSPEQRAEFTGLRKGQILSFGASGITARIVDTPRVTSSASPNRQGYIFIPIEEITDRSGWTIDAQYALTAPMQDGLLKTQAEAVGDAGAGTGAYALLGAESVTGVKPSIILAPDLGTGTTGGTDDAPIANPLGAALNLSLIHI